MNLLRVIPSIDPRRGGPAEAARRFDTELLRMGHHVEVVSLDAPGTEFAADYPAPVHPIGFRREGYRYSAALVPWLKANAARFDAVLVDGLWQYAGFGTWRALARTRLPYFVFSHGMLDPWFKRAYPLKHLKKWLYWPWAEYRVLRDARAVLFTCEEERLLARRSFWLYRAREAVTAFGTSDVPRDAARLRAVFHARYPGLREQRIALFLGRLHEKKGCDLLIEAVARVAKKEPRLHLVMAGPEDAEWGARLRALAAARGIAERITWTGMLSGDLKWGAFHACEVFCLPSHQENFGIAVAEALACERPVLISNKVNIWREIDADGAGWVDTDTIEGTTRTLERWLAASPAEIASRRQAARQSFERRFKVDQAARTLVGILSAHPAAA
ncbi:MAG: glycosyltransferase [Ramlibacter sp.]